MALDQQLLEVLACPRCKHQLMLIEGGKALLCEDCTSRYPIQNDIPILQLEQAMRKSQHHANTQKNVLEIPSLLFQITQGNDAGLTFEIERKTCKAVGRSSHDTDNTTLLRHVDLTLALDQSTKALIMKYITKQFQAAAAHEDKKKKEWFGTFQRVPDLILHDTSLSHLHAMFFADEHGRIGILDLVSKNGTYVNGREIESQLLKEGDVIELGDTKIVYEGLRME